MCCIWCQGRGRDPGRVCAAWIAQLDCCRAVPCTAPTPPAIIDVSGGVGVSQASVPAPENRTVRQRGLWVKQRLVSRTVHFLPAYTVQMLINRDLSCLLQSTFRKKKGGGIGPSKMRAYCSMLEFYGWILCRRIGALSHVLQIEACKKTLKSRV